MANLRNIFLKGVEIIFSTFNEAVNSGTYSVETDNGFDDSSTASDEIRCIFESFVEKDISLLSFGSMIQPQDIKGLMPAVDLVNCEMTTKGQFTFDEKNYTVEGYDLDPMNVLFTLLLRKV